MVYRLLLQEKDGEQFSNQVKKFCEDLYLAGNRSPHLLAMIVHMCEEEILKGNLGNPYYNIQKAEAICNDLAKQYDVIRHKYWNYVLSVLQKKASQVPNTVY